MLMLTSVFGALMCLTGLTVAVAQFDLGAMDLSMAMIIATIKAVIVAVFFMHLNHDKGVNRLFFIGSILFAGIFLSIVVGDAHHYNDDVVEYHFWTSLP